MKYLKVFETKFKPPLVNKYGSSNYRESSLNNKFKEFLILHQNSSEIYNIYEDITLFDKNKIGEIFKCFFENFTIGSYNNERNNLYLHIKVDYNDYDIIFLISKMEDNYYYLSVRFYEKGYNTTYPVDSWYNYHIDQISGLREFLTKFIEELSQYS
jgi:hypothetical protein